MGNMEKALPTARLDVFSKIDAFWNLLGSDGAVVEEKSDVLEGQTLSCRLQHTVL